MDISFQKHVQKVIQTKQPVLSDVFTAVQGFDAVACHMPVMQDGIYRGSLAVLIPFAHLAKEYLDNIRIGKNGYAWLISREGTELYCPIPGHLGHTVAQTVADSPPCFQWQGK